MLGDVWVYCMGKQSVNSCCRKCYCSSALDQGGEQSDRGSKQSVYGQTVVSGFGKCPTRTRVAEEIANTSPPNATVKPIPTDCTKPPNVLGNVRRVCRPADVVFCA